MSFAFKNAPNQILIVLPLYLVSQVKLAKVHFPCLATNPSKAFVVKSDLDQLILEPIQRCGLDNYNSRVVEG
jgi:hypothetical protein